MIEDTKFLADDLEVGVTLYHELMENLRERDMLGGDIHTQIAMIPIKDLKKKCCDAFVNLLITKQILQWINEPVYGISQDR